jgi:serine/threonine-protein kinase HipA
MLIIGDNRLSQISVCLEAAANFQLSHAAAIAMVAHQVKVILDHWPQVCDTAALNEVERLLLWRGQILNPFAFEGAPTELRALVA